MEITCMIRYGTKAPAQNKEIFNKMKDTNLEKYGCEFIFGNKTLNEKGMETEDFIHLKTYRLQ